MRKTEFKAQASYCDTVWSGIDIYIPEGTEDFVYHRYSYQSSNGMVYKRICKSKIRYARPDWSEYSEPYFMRHGIRHYLSNYLVNR